MKPYTFCFGQPHPPPRPITTREFEIRKNMGTVGTVLGKFDEKGEVISNFGAISIWVRNTGV